MNEVKPRGHGSVWPAAEPRRLRSRSALRRQLILQVKPAPWRLPTRLHQHLPNAAVAPQRRSPALWICVGLLKRSGMAASWLDAGPWRTGLMAAALDVLPWRTSEPQYRPDADTGTLMAVLLISVNIEWGFCCVSAQTCAPSRSLHDQRAALSGLRFILPLSPPGEKCFDVPAETPICSALRAHSITAWQRLRNRKTNTRQGPLFSPLVIRSSSSRNEAFSRHRFRRQSACHGCGFVVDVAGLWHGVRRVRMIEVQEDTDECGPAGVRSCKHAEDRINMASVFYVYIKVIY